MLSSVCSLCTSKEKSRKMSKESRVMKKKVCHLFLLLYERWADRAKNGWTTAGKTAALRWVICVLWSTCWLGKICAEDQSAEIFACSVFPGKVLVFLCNRICWIIQTCVGWLTCKCNHWHYRSYIKSKGLYSHLHQSFLSCRCFKVEINILQVSLRCQNRMKKLYCIWESGW